MAPYFVLFLLLTPVFFKKNTEYIQDLKKRLEDDYDVFDDDDNDEEIYYKKIHKKIRTHQFYRVGWCLGGGFLFVVLTEFLLFSYFLLVPDVENAVLWFKKKEEE